MSVKKIMTFKSGQFVFSRRYDRAALESLLLEARVLRQTVAELPALPWLVSTKLDEEEILRHSIRSNVALEGNPLGEDEVGRILSGEDPVYMNNRAVLETHNFDMAYRMIRRGTLGDGAGLVDEAIIKTIHGLVTGTGFEHEHNQPGSYREQRVWVGDREHGGVYTPPKIRPDIENLMREFIAWINGDDLRAEEPIIRAALAHFHLAKIHPFGDGNGRTARLVEALCLQAHGLGHIPIMLANYYYQHMDDYYRAFSRAERHPEHDATPFVEFVLRAFIAACYEMKNRMVITLRRFALRDFLAFLLRNRRIGQRQHGLVSLLLENLQPFALDDLFREPRFAPLYAKVSQRTARRDLARLSQENLLAQDGQGRYRLNTKAVDFG